MESAFVFREGLYLFSYFVSSSALSFAWRDVLIWPLSFCCRQFVDAMWEKKARRPQTVTININTRHMSECGGFCSNCQGQTKRAGIKPFCCFVIYGFANTFFNC